MIASRLDFAVAAEAAGIGHYHVTEHHGTPLSVCPAPNLFLAALSQRTTRLRMGALVYVLPAHEPLRLAEELAVLDQLTNGRLDVGVGSGVSPYELAYFGIDAGQARARYAETLDLVTRALATGRMTHTGTLLRDYDVELSIGPVQRPHPPLWYASSNTGTAEWAGARRQLRRPLERRRVRALGPGLLAGVGRPARRRDRPPPAAGLRGQRLHRRDRRRGHGTLPQGQRRVRLPAHKLWHDHGNHQVDALYDTDRTIANGNSLVGSAGTVRDLLIERVRQAPVNYFEATLAFGDLTAAEAQANLTAFTETVMPAVRQAAAVR